MPSKEVTTKDMFLAMFAAAPVIAPAVHRAAWRHAQATDGYELAKLLVGRPDAPADLVAEYATLTATELRGVYLARSDVHPDQVHAGLRGERRASVLLDALVRSNRHPAALAAAVEAFLAKPTKTLVDQLRTLPAEQMTPALADAILTVYSRFAVSEEIPDLGAVLGYLGPDRVRSWLPTLDHPTLVSQLLVYDVGDDLALETFQRLGARLLGTVERTAWGHNRARIAMLELARAVLAGRAGHPETAQAFGDLLRDYRGALVVDTRNELGSAANRNRPYRAWPAGAGDETRTVVDPAALTDAPAAVDILDVAAADTATLYTLACSADPGTVAAVAAQAAAMDPASFGWPEVALLLLRNPHLTVTARHRLVAQVADAGTCPRLAKLDVLTLFPDDDVVRDTWCTWFPDEVLTRHGWGPFGGPKAAASLLAAWATDTTENPQYEAAVEVGLKTGVPAEALLELPMSRLRLLYGGLFGTELLTGFVADFLAEHLADSPDAWNVFNRIQGSFAGTLGELLHTCQVTTT